MSNDRKITIMALLAGLLFVSAMPAYSWGFYGHKQINGKAVFTLPPEMLGFYKRHLDFLTQHSIDADRRRHTSEQEAPRHYIDLECYFRFEQHAVPDSIPFHWKEAIARYGEDSLNAWGTLPWSIKQVYYALIDAFERGNTERILRHSADLGHYVADGHVPLHTTENHNGQLSGQKGIHALWESRIPEQEAETYNYLTGAAAYIDDLDVFLREMITGSHREKDTVLLVEKKLSLEFGSDLKYTVKDKYNGVERDYSPEFVTAYARSLNGMVERKMRGAILDVGRIWYTAWINAGQPDLNKLL